MNYSRFIASKIVQPSLFYFCFHSITFSDPLLSPILRSLSLQFAFPILRVSSFSVYFLSLSLLVLLLVLLTLRIARFAFCPVFRPNGHEWVNGRMYKFPRWIALAATVESQAGLAMVLDSRNDLVIPPKSASLVERSTQKDCAGTKTAGGINKNVPTERHQSHHASFFLAAYLDA